MKNSLKVGDLVYLKDVGFPYDRTDDGHESWEGASCIVLALNAGYYKDMIRVEPLLPIGDMKECLFYPHSVKKEKRTWLKKHLKDIFRIKAKLRGLANEIQAQLT